MCPNIRYHRLVPGGAMCPNIRYCRLTPEGGMCPKHFNIKYGFSDSSASIFPVLWALPAHVFVEGASNPAQGCVGQLTWWVLPSSCKSTSWPRKPWFSVSWRQNSRENFQHFASSAFSPRIPVFPGTAAISLGCCCFR